MDFARQFTEFGYTVFNINDDLLIDRVNEDVANILKVGDVKTNSKIYSYNNSPRIVESYKHSENCLALAKHSSVIDMIKLVAGKNPRPFSTINFIRSTQQPLHSDYVHFGTVPELELLGSWVALEDINPNSGPLQLVPKSHKSDIFEFSMVAEKSPRSISDIKNQYSLYEDWVKVQLTENKMKSITPVLKKGDCVLWSANLLHGSPACTDNTLSRKSQVTHWCFDTTEMHYNPNFSQVSKGSLVTREVTYF